MNRKEYLNSTICRKNSEYKQIQKLLNQWKLGNNIKERCVVHHRDDTIETRKYNEEHYELWGFNEDGTFELGKYVQFLTATEHMIYHNTGKHHSDETKAKMSASNKGKKYFYGKHHSYETRVKMGISRKANLEGIKFLYTVYKNNGGEKKWNDFQAALKSGDITFEMQRITIFI